MNGEAFMSSLEWGAFHNVLCYLWFLMYYGMYRLFLKV